MADRRRTLAVTLAAVVVSLSALPTLAQEVIPTGAYAPLGGAPTPPPPPGIHDAQQRLPGGDNVMRNVNGCGAPPTEDGKTDKTPHGEVNVGVGNHGYREAGGVVCVPVGDHAAATIAVQAGQYPTLRGR